jgi:hypothetical protein
MTPFSNHFGGSCAAALVKGECTAGWYGGADLSIFFGMGAAALVYLGLELVTGYVRRQNEARDALTQ